MNYNLLCLVLLASCTGCKNDTAPVTLIQSANCRIATQTTKELVSPSQTSTLEPETVTIDGESFQVTTTKKSSYSYDAQGRILTEYNQYAGVQAYRAGGKADSVFYQYSPMSVSIRTVTFADTGKNERIQVVVLNSQGFAEKQPSTNLATYDKDGYLTTLRDEYGRNIAKIDNGNVLELTFSDSPSTPSYTYKNEYDLNKSGLPSIQPFYGKPARNLLIKQVVDEHDTSQTYPNVHTTIYAYTFDNEGNVKRQLLRGKDGEIGYIYGGDSASVIDFTYNCP